MRRKEEKEQKKEIKKKIKLWGKIDGAMKKEQDQALSKNFGSWVRNNSDRSVFALATKPKRIDFIKSVYVRCRSCARARLNFSSQKFMDLVGCEMAQMEGKKNPNEFGEFVLMLITRTQKTIWQLSFQSYFCHYKIFISQFLLRNTVQMRLCEQLYACLRMSGSSSLSLLLLHLHWLLHLHHPLMRF